MFSSERISYNAPLPGEEFKNRDVSVPAEAAKILYEIDSNMDKIKNCVSQFLDGFFGGWRSPKILHEVAQNFGGGSVKRPGGFKRQ